MNLELKNKIAFVAGSSDGLGFAAALELAREKANVVLTGRKQDRLETAAKKIITLVPEAKLLLCQVDLTDKNSIQHSIEKAATHFGGLDILITNAGGPPKGMFAELDEEQWATGFQLTLMSTVRLIRYALPHLRKSDTASILTITSSSGKQPIPGLLISNVFRPGILGLTKTLSLELAKDNIRVNSILPGWTATDRTIDLLNFYSEKHQTTTEDETARIAADIPLQRIARPEEFGKAATFLVSSAASYITGVMLSVDGGSHKAIV